MMVPVVGVEEEIEVFSKSSTRLLRLTTRGAQPHNRRTPIKSGLLVQVSSTRHYACNTNQLLTNYSSTNRLLAVSLALLMAILPWPDPEEETFCLASGWLGNCGNFQ